MWSLNSRVAFFFFFSFALKFYLFGFLILIPNTDCLFSCQDNYFSSFICSLLQIQWNCFKFFICKTSWQTTLQRKLFLLQRFSALSHLWVHAQSLAQSCSTLCEPMTVAHQPPSSMGFSKQEYWSGLTFPPPGDLPDPGIEPQSHVSCIGRQILYHWVIWEVPFILNTLFITIT